MKALILIIVIGLIILVAAIWADTALAQVSPDCYRQAVFSWSEDQTVTTFSVLHVKPNGKTPAVSCGAIAKTNLYKWREYFDLGVKCWPDMCIQNWIANDKPGGQDKFWTKVVTRNGYKLVHLGIWNVR